MERNRNRELPETPYQEIVYQAWKKALNHDSYGVEDDFFDVGGTSLAALQVISELNVAFEVDMDTFFVEPTIKNIASCLRENPESMKQRFADILQFRPLRKIDTGEWKNYEQQYQGINNIQKDTARYKNVFLLGATGFLGIYLLHELLSQTSVGITVLIRDHPEGGMRLKQHYDNYFGSGAFVEQAVRIQTVKGDLTQDQMGLPLEVYQKLSESVDAIVNSAALVKHMGKNEEFDAVNINIVKNILEFAAHGCKKAVHHMSTIGIAYGEQAESEKTLFTEQDEIISHPLNNQYLASKYRAEQILIQARKDGIESTIYRMNGILFDSQNGRYQQNMEQSTAYIFYRALYKLGIIPTGILRPMDISNVDMVSKAIICLMFSNYSENQMHHVINPNALLIGDILKFMRGEHGSTKLKPMSVDEVYIYYKQDDKTKKKYFHELVFECEIISAIGKNTYNICMQKTNHVLRMLGFEWNKADMAEIQLACAEAKKVGFYE